LTDPNKQSGSSPTPDFICENHGSIFLLKPLTPSAESWLEENIGQENAFQPYWPTCVIEHRYVSDIVAGIENDGLAVQS
jgi:hypothetical protein